MTCFVLERFFAWAQSGIMKEILIINIKKETLKTCNTFKLVAGAMKQVGKKQCVTIEQNGKKFSPTVLFIEKTTTVL